MIGSVPDRDEEVQISVVVEVDPTHLASVRDQLDIHICRHFGEKNSVTVVAIQNVGALFWRCESHVKIDVSVAVEITPSRGPRVFRVGQANSCGNIHKDTTVVSVHTICASGSKADEKIVIAVVIEIGPCVCERLRCAEQFWLHQLELWNLCLC